MCVTDTWVSDRNTPARLSVRQQAASGHSPVRPATRVTWLAGAVDSETNPQTVRTAASVTTRNGASRRCAKPQPVPARSACWCSCSSSDVVGQSRCRRLSAPTVSGARQQQQQQQQQQQCRPGESLACPTCFYAPPDAAHRVMVARDQIADWSVAIKLLILTSSNCSRCCMIHTDQLAVVIIAELARRQISYADVIDHLSLCPFTSPPTSNAKPLCRLSSVFTVSSISLRRVGLYDVC